jgi:hypothetical protein
MTESGLVANLMHFGRLLRGAGLPVGPERVLSALRAAEAVGVERRDDFYCALHAVFVNRREHHEVFDEAFRLFWREPLGAEAALGALAPRVRAPVAPRAAPAARRVGEALAPARPAVPQGERRVDVALGWSDVEALRRKDFEQMSAEELRRTKEAVARLSLPLPEITTRRLRADPRGARVDLRATLRAALRSGGGIPLRWRSVLRRPPALVVLCDVSGSMERYTRVLLHFLHALTGDRERVYSFLFGTRLSHVTRQLRGRDPDQAMGHIAALADFGGGTRIGACLREFNLRWSRRLCAQGALCLLITDGLDRDAGRGIAAEAARLRRSCRRLIWLNPLLRYEGFEPLAAGVRALLPHVDEMRPVHNLESLEELARALGRAGADRG